MHQPYNQGGGGGGRVRHICFDPSVEEFCPSTGGEKSSLDEGERAELSYVKRRMSMLEKEVAEAKAQSTSESELQRQVFRLQGQVKQLGYQSRIVRKQRRLQREERRSMRVDYGYTTSSEVSFSDISEVTSSSGEGINESQEDSSILETSEDERKEEVTKVTTRKSTGGKKDVSPQRVTIQPGYARAAPGNMMSLFWLLAMLVSICNPIGAVGI